MKHGGSVGPSVLASLAGGKGKRRAEDSRQALQIDAARRAAGRQRAHSTLQSQAARRHSMTEAEKNRQHQLEMQSRRLEGRRNDVDADDRAFSAADLIDLDRIRQAEARDLGLARGGKRGWVVGDSVSVDKIDTPDHIERRFTSKQRAEFDHLSQVYQDAVESELYTEEELQDIKRQIHAKQLGIEPQEHLREESPWEPGQDVGQVWQTPDGFTVTRKPDGSIQKLGDTRTQLSGKDTIAIYDQVFKEMQESAMAGAENWKPTPEFYQQVREASTMRIREIQAIMRGDDVPGAEGEPGSGGGGEPPRGELDERGFPVKRSLPKSDFGPASELPGLRRSIRQLSENPPPQLSFLEGMTYDQIVENVKEAAEIKGIPPSEILQQFLQMMEQ